MESRLNSSLEINSFAEIQKDAWISPGNVVQEARTYMPIYIFDNPVTVNFLGQRL